MNNKYFLYARKSTDVEDKQVLSTEAQIAELRAFAKQNSLAIVEELTEKQSAKIPGRHIFHEDMLVTSYSRSSTLSSSLLRRRDLRHR